MKGAALINRAAALTGLVLVSVGLVVFVWKAVVLGMPLAPSDPGNVWRVELEIDARGTGGRGSVRAALPSSEAGQVIFDERLVSDQLLFTIRTEGRQRIGVWSGRFRRVHEIGHAFRVQLSEQTVTLDGGSAAGPPPAEVVSDFGRPERELPSESLEVQDVLLSLNLPAASDTLARARTLFGFVTDEVATVRTGSDDALLTLAAREGSEIGKARLLVTLLRAAEIPARLAAGLRVRPGSPPQLVWTEAWLNGWAPLSPTEGFFGTRPADVLLLERGGASLVQATGLDAVVSRYRVLREGLRPEELATIMQPANPALASVSLYRLPVATQAALRVILVLPLGALLVAVFRNLIGLPTFGTFMPVLIGLALRGTGLGLGLALVGSVIVVGIVGRLLLDRLRLLLVPRLCILLCLVVITIMGLALLGHGFESRDLFAGVLFPIIILTMLIERFSITTAEEGLQQALTRLASSLVVAIFAYPIFGLAIAQHLMFGFPELVICVMGLLVWIGGYTGYRVRELLRFRALAHGAIEPLP